MFIDYFKVSRLCIWRANDFCFPTVYSSSDGAISSENVSIFSDKSLFSDFWYEKLDHYTNYFNTIKNKFWLIFTSLNIQFWFNLFVKFQKHKKLTFWIKFVEEGFTWLLSVIRRMTTDSCDSNLSDLCSMLSISL